MHLQGYSVLWLGFRRCLQRATAEPMVYCQKAPDSATTLPDQHLQEIEHRSGAVAEINSVQLQHQIEQDRKLVSVPGELWPLAHQARPLRKEPSFDRSRR